MRGHVKVFSNQKIIFHQRFFGSKKIIFKVKMITF
jgi:hypothetical protein